MSRVRNFYDALLRVCAAVAGILLFLLVGLIVANVIGRSSGLYNLDWSVPVSEYALQFSTMLAAPLILHKKGHTFMVFGHGSLPDKLRIAVEKGVYVICLGLCWGIAYFAGLAAWHNFTSGTLDIRSIDIPGWILYASLVLGFGLMGVEFARFLVGADSMYRNEDQSTQGL